MRHTTSRHSTRIRLAVGTALTLTAIVAITGLVAGTPPPPVAPTTVPAASDNVGVGTAPDARDPQPSAADDRADPVGAARLITRELLTFDTTAALSPTDHTSNVIAWADPSGVETPGLLADLTNYLPTITQWQQLRRFGVTQTVTIQDASVPNRWGDIVASDPDSLSEGTTAVTISAVRHRHGVSAGQYQTTDHPLTFTMFLTCPSATDGCALLRLSLPDRPLV